MQLDEETVLKPTSWDHVWNTNTNDEYSLEEEKAFVTQAEQFTNEVVANIRDKLKVS